MAKSEVSLAREIGTQTDCIVAAILAAVTTPQTTPQYAFKAYFDMLQYLRSHGGAENPTPEL
jgi:hypothetical protein